MAQLQIYICVCVLITLIKDPNANAFDLLSLLFDEDINTRRMMEPYPDPEKSKIIHQLSQVPFTSKVKSNAWYKINKFRRVDMIHDTEWKIYEPLIPYMPPEMFQMVNYTDEGVLKTFGQFKLSPTQLSMIAEEISEKWGVEILENEDKVFKMGNIFCGFPETIFHKLNSSTLKYLLKKNFFQSLHGCTTTALRSLTKELQRYTIVGPTRAWTPEITSSLGVLLAGLDAKQLRSLRDDCISRITPEVVHEIPVNVLENLRQEQLQAFTKETLLAWRRKTRDMRYLYEVVNSSSKFSFLPLISFFSAFCVLIIS